MIAKSMHVVRFKAAVLGRKRNDIQVVICSERDIRPSDIRAIIAKITAS